MNLIQTGRKEMAKNLTSSLSLAVQYGLHHHDLNKYYLDAHSRGTV